MNISINYILVYGSKIILVQPKWMCCKVLNLSIDEKIWDELEVFMNPDGTRRIKSTSGLCVREN